MYFIIFVIVLLLLVYVFHKIPNNMREAFLKGSDPYLYKYVQSLKPDNKENN